MEEKLKLTINNLVAGSLFKLTYDFQCEMENIANTGLLKGIHDELICIGLLGS